MGRRATIQTTFSKGELDPDLSDRQDLEHYYDSLASAPNSVFHPQGGFSDRGGFALASDQDVIDAGTKRRLRQRIVPLVLDADNLTAPNGGLTTNLVDQDATSAIIFAKDPDRPPATYTFRSKSGEWTGSGKLCGQRFEFTAKETDPNGSTTYSETGVFTFSDDAHATKTSQYSPTSGPPGACTGAIARAGQTVAKPAPISPCP